MSQLAIDISKRLDIYVRKNQAINQNIAVNNVDGTPFDFSGYSGTMQVFTGPADNSPNIALTVTLSEGNINFQLAANKIPRQSEFIYFLKLNDILWLNGKFTINGGLFDGVVNSPPLTINLAGNPVYLTISTGTGGSGGTITPDATDAVKGKVQLPHSESFDPALTFDADMSKDIGSYDLSGGALNLSITGANKLNTSITFQLIADGVNPINFTGAGWDSNAFYAISDGEVLDPGTYPVYMTYGANGAQVSIPNNAIKAIRESMFISEI